jgi:hypothetical protein
MNTDIIEVRSPTSNDENIHKKISTQEILSEEIVDETDRYADNVTKQHAKRVTTAEIMRGCVTLPLLLSLDCLLAVICSCRFRGSFAFPGELGISSTCRRASNVMGHA